MSSKNVSYRTKSVGRAKTVKYATEERMQQVNPMNLEIYEQYIQSSTIRNRDVAHTTYKTYRSYMNIFMCYLMEYQNNVYLLDESVIEEQMVDILESYMSFLQEHLGNNKKTINTKLSTISSFYIWALKRKKIKAHPFQNKLDRIKRADEEKIVAEYFLTQREVNQIATELSRYAEPDTQYDLMDYLIWCIAFESACRIGALADLKVTNLDVEQDVFRNVREKGAIEVEIPFYPETGKVIKEFLEQRNRLGVDCEAFFCVFYQDQWRGMSSQGIYNRINRIGHILGLGDFHPHSIRKTRINMVAKLDINKAKLLANHKSLDTTARFYTEKEAAVDVLKEIIRLEANQQ